MKILSVLLTISVAFCQNPMPGNGGSGGGGGSGATIASTLNIISGDGSGNGISSGIAPSDIVLGKGGINVTKSPYYASGFTAQAYTNSGTAAGVTVTLTMSSVTGFSVGQYMYCLGMGTGGVKQHVLISAINTGTKVITFTPAAIQSVSTEMNCWTEGDTTGTVGAGGTTITVGSSASYTSLRPEGVYLADGISSGVPYIGTVVSVVDATHITVTPAVTAAVTGGLFQHDDTAAIQLFVTNNAYFGGDAYLPGPEAGQYAIYNLNGPYQDSGASATHCNCVILPPIIPAISGASGLSTFSFHGYIHPGSTTAPLASTIQSSQTGGGNLFATYSATASIGKFSQIGFAFKDISIFTYANVDLVPINGTNFLTLNIRDFNCQAGGAAHSNTHTTSTCIIMPTTTNYVESILYNVVVNSFYTGIVAREHTHMDRVYAGTSVVGIEFASASTAHPIYAGYINAENNTTGIFCQTNGGQAYIGLYSVENNTTDVAFGNFLHGMMQVESSISTMTMTGISFMEIRDIKTGAQSGKPIDWQISCPACGLFAWKNTSTTGWGGGTFVDAAGVEKAYMGWANSAFGGAYSNTFFLQSLGSIRFAGIGATLDFVQLAIHPQFTGGTAPAVSACGVSPALVSPSNDVTGKITVGTGGIATSCTLTFGTTWTAAPVCTGNNETTALFAKYTTSATVLTIVSATPFTASDVLTYSCQGRQ